MERATRVFRPAALIALSSALAGVLIVAIAAAPPGLGSTGTHASAGTGAAKAKKPKVIHNACKKSAIDVPACGVLWGLYAPEVPGAGHEVQDYAAYEKLAGRRFDIIKNYVGWMPGHTFPNAQEVSLAGNGQRILDFSWTAADFSTRAKISYQSIANGTWDKSVILPEAQRLKKFPHKVFIDFNHEFDSKAQAGKGTPAQYVAAYRHIHTVMQNAGVHNVIWAWVTTSDVGHAAELAASYPGSAYVDWVGYDPYNFAQCRGQPWHTPYQTFQPFYHWLQTQPGMRSKPIMFGEYASAPGAQVTAWYAGVASALKRLPQVKAVMEWSDKYTSTCDFNLVNSPAASAGFAKSSVASYVTGIPN